MDTTTPPPDQPEQPASEPPRPPDGPRVSSEQMRDLGRLRRSVHDRHVAGVAGGLARHLDIDPIIVRVASCCTPRGGCWCPRRAPTTSRSASTSGAAASR
jgi:hypothetical protein